MRRAFPLSVLALWASLATACTGGDPQAQPSIEFTLVPEAAAGGSERTARIAGRVAGARSGSRVVLYAKTDVWWVQPLTAQPFTPVAANGSWDNSTHLGREYAALLVDETFRPAAKVEALPERGGSVLAVASVAGIGGPTELEPKLLSFSGYEWEVRQTPSDRGGANDYAASNAWTDSDGFLHLRLSRRDGHWFSAEVILARSLGYGTYAFTVQDVSSLDPSAVLGMLTWDDAAAAQNHRELDVEISQWGNPDIPNAQYVLQPYYVPANVSRFSAPPGTLTHSFRWEPGRAAFRTTRGANPLARTTVASHEFTSGVPTPGSERVRINLYYFRYSPQPPGRDVEVVIERFHYLP
jgi:hypothetical protein